jgi:hypothetical protein
MDQLLEDDTDRCNPLQRVTDFDEQIAPPGEG